MLDPKLIRNNPEAIRKGLKNRKADASMVDNFLTLDEEWRKVVAEADALKARRNALSEQVGERKQKKEPADDLINEVKSISGRIKELDAK